MSLYIHALSGCTPTPLANYLKALGVLRLVSSQADADARGFWREEKFCLTTTLDEDALLRFFLERYEPTPMLSPWNGGSGFYPGDKSKKDGYVPLRDSQASRFAQFRAAIARAEVQVAGREERPADEDKQRLLRACVSTWDLASYAWLRAAFSIDASGDARYPAILGSGGNDGRLDFANNYMQRLVQLFDVDTGGPTTRTEGLLRASLVREIRPGLEEFSIGQFFPGAAGGANSTAGFDGDSLVNAWDFVLMLEGVLVLRVAALRRLDSDDLAQAAAPFALHSQGSGYGSASPVDASARGEQWLPLWSRASTLAEVNALFDEGRLHGGHRAARSTLDATRALAKLGVARGVEAFARFGYFERNGQSNLAVPLGTLRVEHRPNVRVLDELDGFVRGLGYAASRVGAPLSLPRAERALERAMLAASLPTATPATWGELIAVLGDVEHGFVAHGKSTKDANLRPIPRLSARWLALIDDGSPEVRLAIAIASQGDTKLGPIRTNMVPLEAPFYTAFATTSDSLANDPSVVWEGRSLVTDLAAIALRRVVDSARSRKGADGGHANRAKGFPLSGKRFASLADVELFLGGHVDDTRISRLVRGLACIDWAHAAASGAGQGRGAVPIPLHALVRMAYLPHEVPPLKPRLDAAPLRLLAVGRLADAAQLLTQRLVTSGLRAKVRDVAGSAGFSRRLAASVAIPISARDYGRLVACLSKPFANDTTETSSS